MLLLVRDKAALLGQALNLPPYDALVDEFSPGVGTADIDAIFKALTRRLPGMISEALEAQQQRPLLPITGKFATGKQRGLVVEVMKALGFPFDRGRLDESEHPFTEGVAGDIRVTTRYDGDRSVHGPARRAARDRSCDVRPGDAARAGATSRWAAIAAWRWRKASRCCSR